MTNFPPSPPIHGDASAYLTAEHLSTEPLSSEPVSGETLRTEGVEYITVQAYSDIDHAHITI